MNREREPVLFRCRIGTPVGLLTLLVDGERLAAVLFEDQGGGPPAAYRGSRTIVDHPDPAGTASRLRAYFAGDLGALDAIEVAPHGTPFQTRVRLALRHIPPGETRSYAELAAAVGHPRAVRAVGRANATNPVPIVLPCHRVIGTDGRLTGYGGGLWRKAWLLRHEGALAC